jgi:hypothetical protein
LDEGAEQIKMHPFFSGVDWDAVLSKEIPVPFKPKTSDQKDTSQIDKVYLSERPVDSPVTTKLTES